MVEEIRTARVERNRTSVVLVARIERDCAAQVCVEMDGARHRPQIVWHVSVNGVRCEWAETRTVNTRSSCRDECGAIVERAVTIGVCTSGYVVRSSWPRRELAVQLDLERQRRTSFNGRAPARHPPWPATLALLAIARLRRLFVLLEAQVCVVKMQSEALHAGLVQRDPIVRAA